MMKNMKKATLMGVALLGCLQVSASNANDYAKQYTQAYSAINDSIVANDKAAVAVLSDLAKKNYPQAVVAMGQVYSYGIDVPQDFAKAKEYYNQAIKIGCQGVDVALRDCDKRQNYASRIDQIRKGVKQGDAKSCGELGWCYANGVVVDFDNDRAIQCFNLGAEKNDALSMYELGVRHFIGYGVKRDINKAVKLFEKAAQGGNVDAQYQMALIYDEATPLAKDNAKAVNWYDKAVAQNHDAALYNTALHYMTGSLRGINEKKAVECLQKSSDLGNADAAYLLGYLYEQGEIVIADSNKALQLYQLAFSRGNCDAAVGAGRIWMFKLKNDVKAKEWFDKAAEKGAKQGEYYRYILNNSSNVKTLEKRAKDGDVEAAKVLSICYYEGLGVAKNDKNAFKFMKKAAEKDVDANYQLAQYYINGVGTKKDYKKAVECFKKYNPMCAEIALYSNAVSHQKQFNAYRKAANEGNAEAYFMLHICYEHGFGVEANAHMSHQMLVNSASLGHAPAQRKLAAYWSEKNDSFSVVKTEYWKNKYQAK